MILSTELNNYIGYCVLCNKKPIEKELMEDEKYYQKIFKKIKPEEQDEIKKDIKYIKEKMKK